MGIKRDFVVESNGICFICLKRSGLLLQKSNRLKREPDISGPTNLPIYSLQSLSRFLKMDMDEAFKNRDDVHPHLLDMVIKSTLKAELCGKCSNLMEKFSLLNQQLEKIRMEVMSSLRNIHEKLIGVNEEDKIELDKMAQLQGRSMTNLNDGWLYKLDILEILRSQAIEKCSDLIHSSGPRIKVENLNMKELSVKKLKLRRKSKGDANAEQSILSKEGRETDQPEIEIRNIKSEYPIESPANEDGDVNSNHSSSYLPDEELNNAEIKVDVHELRLPRTPGPNNQDTHRVYDDEAKLVVPPPRRSSQLTGTIVPFNPSTVNGKYHCNLCDKQYKTRHVVSKHYNRVHQKIRYICNACDKEFAKRQAYKGHYQAVHFGGVGLTCKKCNRTFTAKANLERHQRMVSCAAPAPSDKKRHFCELCESSYSTVDCLKEHAKAAHLKSSSHVCSQCTKKFRTLRTLKRHVQRVHKVVRRCCNLCPKSYKSKASLDYHKLAAHSSVGRQPRIVPEGRVNVNCLEMS